MALLAPPPHPTLLLRDPIPFPTQTTKLNNPSTSNPTKPQPFGARKPRPHTRIFSSSFTEPPTTKSPRNSTASSRPYVRQNSCLVFPPPRGKKPKAIVMFLGGAFIGAVPEVTYSYLIKLLAKEGFLIIAVPYDVTFDHSLAAKEVYERFGSCLDELLTIGFPFSGIVAEELVHVPVYSVGHSNGALLQLLVGSYYSEKIPKANAIISFNNRPASEAVPYFEQVGPLIRQSIPFVEASPIYSMVRSASGDALNLFEYKSGALTQTLDPETVISLRKFVDQLPSVINQVTRGISEFKPPPSENREFISQSYNVQHTLLVKFTMDNIDETDILESVLRSRVESMSCSLEKVTLSGNHITPCAQDIKWKIGDLYTPADAVAQALKSLSLTDTRTLARTIIEWLDGIKHE